MTTELELADGSDTEPSLGRHREMLVAMSSVVLLALLLQVLPDGSVAFRGLSRFALPPSCMSRILFGLDCPGCGLTRSLIHMAHGNWTRAIHAHRFGPVMAMAILVQIPYRIYGLRRRDPFPIGRLIPAVFGYFLIFGLIANWVYNQCIDSRKPVESPSQSAPAR